MTPTEMQLGFAGLLGTLQAVQTVALDGLPFGALTGYASGQGGQAFHLLWYPKAKVEGKSESYWVGRMRELTTTLRVWVNILPAHERIEWASKGGRQIKRGLPAIEAPGGAFGTRRLAHSPS